MPLKILILTHKFYPDIGGIEGNSEILANEFSRAGHEVTVLTWSLDGDRKQFPFSIIRCPTQRQMIEHHKKTNIIIENNPCLRLSWPRLIYRRPSIIVINTWISRPDGSIGLMDRIKKVWLSRSTRVIAVSEALRKKCWTKSIVIGNPYKSEFFQSYTEIERANGFVFLGRLVSDKGADQAILAIAILLKENFPFKPYNTLLTIIGNGPESKKLQQLVVDLKLAEYIKFTSALSGKLLAEQLNRHNYILVPSVWEEPFGNVVLEGLACGLLPIVSDGGGLPEAVGKAGVAFKRGDVMDLVLKIKQLHTNPQIEAACRKAAQSHLREHQPATVAGKYLEVVKEIC